MPYNVGDVAKLKITISKEKVLADPTVLRLKYKPPQSDAVTLVFGTNSEIVRDSVGQYHANIPINKSGIWFYRWESIGPASAAGAIEKTFTVNKTAFS